MPVRWSTVPVHRTQQPSPNIQRRCACPRPQRQANADDKRKAGWAGSQVWLNDEQCEELRGNPPRAVCSFSNTEEVWTMEAQRPVARASARSSRGPTNGLRLFRLESNCFND